MPGVIADAMSRSDAPDKVRVALRPLADEKKCRRNIEAVKHVQNERRALGMRAIIKGEVNLIRLHRRAAPQPGHELDKKPGHALKAVEEKLCHKGCRKTFPNGLNDSTKMTFSKKRLQTRRPPD